MFPDIAAHGLTGGAVWYDYQARHPDRLNWTVAQAAMRAGAVLENYVEAVEPLVAGDRVAGARVRDALDGSTHDIAARATVVAAGSGAEEVLRRFGAPHGPIALVRAANLVLDRPGPPMAIAAAGPSGRVLTAVPWAGLTLVGTWQSDEPIDPATPSDVPGPLLDAMLAEVNATFPSLQVTARDVRVVHHGLTPAVVRNGRADLMPASLVLGPGSGTRPGLFAVVGVKFTTARQTAEATIDRIAEHLGQAIGPSRTATTPLPHGLLPDLSIETDRGQALADLASATRTHLLDWYGTEAPDVASFATAHGLLDPLDAGTPVIAGEIAYAAAHARAVRLPDAVLRRTRLGSTGHPGDAALERAAAVMGRILNWTRERQAGEIAAVLTRYVTRPRTP
jgi:glycerol-3-phosphate dehydrogenase